MIRDGIAETLENQLQLLFECSKNCVDAHELVELTKAMVAIVSALHVSGGENGER